MPKTLEGSCHCGAVAFSLESSTPIPYQLCACSICRKVGGYGGSVNLGGDAKSLKIIKGKDQIKKYNAVRDRGTPHETTCSSERSFCMNCSAMLWLWDERWPELIHPFASAIDTELTPPEEMVCVMASGKPAWVRWPEGKKTICERYNGETSIEVWHRERGLFVE